MARQEAQFAGYWQDLPHYLASRYEDIIREVSVSCSVSILCDQRLNECVRDRVAKLRKTPKNKAKECKCFRSERRECRLGDAKPYKMCKKPTCRLCKAIKTGFKASLEFKRNMVKRHAK